MKNYIRVEIVEIDGIYYLIDPKKGDIRLGDLVAEKTISGWRLEEINDKKDICIDLQRRVIANQKEIGVRRTDTGMPEKCKSALLKKLHNIKDDLIIKIEAIDEYEDPKKYSNKSLWTEDLIPVYENGFVLLTTSMLYNTKKLTYFETKKYCKLCNTWANFKLWVIKTFYTQ